MSERAFLTGVSGFAGRQLAAQLREAGWQVAGSVVSHSSGVAGVAEHCVQIDDLPALTKLIGEFNPTVVFHLAAIVDTVQTLNVLELHRVNTLGTVAVTEALAAAGSKARLVFASSAFAYGHVESGANRIVESTPLRPVTPYGASKAAAEAIVRQFARLHGNHVVVTRAFQHTGPGHTGAYALADWAQQLARLEQSGQPGQIAVGELSVARDYLDVRDVAAAYIAAAKDGRSGAVYNVCSGRPVTMRELLEGLIAQFDVTVEVVTDHTRLRKVDQPVFVGDPSALQGDTGWHREFPLESTLAALAQFWRDRIGN